MWRRTARDRVFIAFLVLCDDHGPHPRLPHGHPRRRRGRPRPRCSASCRTGVRAFVSPFESVVRTIGDLGQPPGREPPAARARTSSSRRQAETYTDVQRENARITELLQLEGRLGSARRPRTGRSGPRCRASSARRRSTRDADAGIVTDRAVLAPEGLVGRVVVGRAPASAKVLLLTDAQSAVGVRIGDVGRDRARPRDRRPEPGARARLARGARPGCGEAGGRSCSRPDTRAGSTRRAPGRPRRARRPRAPRGTSYTITVRPFVRFSQLDIVAVAVSRTEVVEAPPTPDAETGGAEPMRRYVSFGGRVRAAHCSSRASCALSLPLARDRAGSADPRRRGVRDRRASANGGDRGVRRRVCCAICCSPRRRVCRPSPTRSTAYGVALVGVPARCRPRRRHVRRRDVRVTADLRARCGVPRPPGRSPRRCRGCSSSRRRTMRSISPLAHARAEARASEADGGATAGDAER